MLAARVHLWVRVGLAGLGVAAGLAVTGCADLSRATGMTPEPLDANSAVAAQVEAATHTHYPMPSFRDVPPRPTDIRTPGGFKTAVVEGAQARDRLDNWVAANPAEQPLDSTATEAFATSQRARIPAGEMTAPAPVGSEEYAARLRALATPPPPPQ
jgi:hypothetical protein